MVISTVRTGKTKMVAYEEAWKYVSKYRGQTSLFEDMDQEENGGDKDEG